MSKYRLLWEYVSKSKLPLTLSFKEAENILGFPIDHSFLNYKKELSEYGCEVKKISLKAQSVVFDRAE